MLKTVAVAGAGIASYSTALLLSQHGWKCDLYISKKPKSVGPQLILNDVAESLLAKICPTFSLSSMAHAIEHRNVLWGKDSSPQKVIQRAWSIAGNGLLSELNKACTRNNSIRVVDTDHSKINTDNYDFTINLPATNQTKIPCGHRLMLSTLGNLSEHAESNACNIESLPNGWLFLAPCSKKKASLQLVLPSSTTPYTDLDLALKDSWMISPKVVGMGPIADVPCYPQIIFPLVHNRNINVGEHAARLDPVSGEGTPFALRSAILACATINQYAKSGDYQVLQHYQSRLTYSFMQHLKGCCNFYQTTFEGIPQWQNEISTMKQVMHGLSELYESHLPNINSYSLQELELVHN